MSNRIIKKLGAVLLSAALGTVACFAAAAADTTVTIGELDNLQLSLPENMTAVTRSTDASDRYFSLHGLDYSTIMANFDTASIYMQATDDMETITVTLSALDNEQSRNIGNYNILSSGQLSEIAQNFTGISDPAAKYTECTPDEAGNDSVWLNFALYSTDSATGQSFRQFQSCTVYEGKNYSITIQRNGKNVQEEDYFTLMSIVKSVKFKPDFFGGDKTKLFIIIGASAVAAIVLLIIVIVAVKKAKRHRKKTQNNKILEELADKYSARKSNGYVSDDTEQLPKAEDDKESDFDSGMTDILGYENEVPDAQESAPQISYRDYDLDAFDDSKLRRYTDEEIDRLLGDTENNENFTETLTENAADSEATSESEDSVTEEADSISEFFEDAPTVNAPVYTEQTVLEQEESEKKQPENKSDGDTDDGADDGKSDVSDESGESDEFDEDFNEYASDEVLAREEAKQNKFKDSEDFFDEAPGKKIYGVISSREIEEAEDYDVIGEVEQKAEKLEKEPPKPGQTFVNVMKKIGTGLKNFGVHCGYFATNVKRSIKRKRAVKKRKQAEEDRRRRARERAQRQRMQQEMRDSSGLVQVRRRTDRRPPQNRR